MEELDEITLEETLFIENGECFRELYDRYFCALCSFAMRYVEDRQLAADLVQDAYVALWRLRRNFRSEAAVRSFLYTATRNLALNQLKRNRIRGGRLNLETDDVLEPEEVQSVMSSEVKRQLVSLVEGLPRECRRVLKLSIEGKSYKEIGRIMNIAVSTVRNHRIRAVKLLKTRFRQSS